MTSSMRSTLPRIDMASQRKAVIAGSRNLNGEVKLLDLAMPEGDPLNFVGGQYVIVNTNIPLPGGKIAKRAYSILSSDSDQGRFQIAVKKVGAGPGSNYMHETQAGSELQFSGPWGQFFFDESLPAGPTLALATDTGITAALGLIRGARFKSRAREARLAWMVESENYFIPHAFVREVCGEIGTGFDSLQIPSVNHPERLNRAGDAFEALIRKGRPENAFLSGDGALLYPFKEILTAAGAEERRIKIECFFNNPFKKVGAL